MSQPSLSSADTFNQEAVPEFTALRQNASVVYPFIGQPSFSSVATLDRNALPEFAALCRQALQMGRGETMERNAPPETLDVSVDAFLEIGSHVIDELNALKSMCINGDEALRVSRISGSGRYAALAMALDTTVHVLLQIGPERLRVALPEWRSWLFECEVRGGTPVAAQMLGTGVLAEEDLESLLACEDGEVRSRAWLELGRQKACGVREDMEGSAGQGAN